MLGWTKDRAHSLRMTGLITWETYDKIYFLLLFLFIYYVHKIIIFSIIQAIMLELFDAIRFEGRNFEKLNCFVGIFLDMEGGIETQFCN